MRSRPRLAAEKEMETFLHRVGQIHGTFHTDGNTVVDKILGTVKEMLTDRGCRSVELAESPLDSIAEGTPVAWGDDGPGSKGVDVYICVDDKVGVKYARSIAEGARRCNILCISKDGPTPFTKKECGGIQFMLCRQLFVNPMRHRLVPKHSRVPHEGFEREKLPRIVDSDPTVQYYNWSIGDVIEITRVIGASETVPYYRVVVQS